ncbi:MAG: DUF4381 domain-containing protein [Candidatus Methylumidiphilus sp.]
MEPQLDLRDIHLPAPVGWWPPAPGWWLLLIGVPLIIVALVWLWRWLRRPTPKKLALQELDKIAASRVGQREKVQQIAILLRRTAMSVYRREAVASLIGMEWLAFLDAPLGGNHFREGAGRLLIEAPYRREVAADLDALLDLCRRWVAALPAPGKAAPPSAPRPDAGEGVMAQPSPPPDLNPSRFARPADPEDPRP